MLFACDLCCGCKHLAALLNIYLNITLSSKSCLFALRGLTASYSHLLLSCAFTRPTSCIYAQYLTTGIYKAFPCLAALSTEDGRSTQLVYRGGKNQSDHLSLALKISVSVSLSQLYHSDRVYYKNPSCIFLVEQLRQLWLVSCRHGNRCCRAGHRFLPLSWKQVQLQRINIKQTTMSERGMSLCLDVLG